MEKISWGLTWRQKGSCVRIDRHVLVVEYYWKNVEGRERREKWCSLWYYRVVELVPISDENSVITGGIVERDRNSGSAQNPETSKSTGSFVECQRREVVEASNLILHLKYVCEVPSWWNGTCCSPNPIFERVPSLLHPVPVFSNITLFYYIKVH